jgi:hypothetical protein
MSVERSGAAGAVIMVGAFALPIAPRLGTWETEAGGDKAWSFSAPHADQLGSQNDEDDSDQRRHRHQEHQC